MSCTIFGRKKHDAVEDSACAMVRFAGGAVLMLEVNWNLREPRTNSYLHIYGSKGAAMLSPLQVHKYIHGVLVNVTPAIGHAESLLQGELPPRDQSLHRLRAQTEDARSRRARTRSA